MGLFSRGYSCPKEAYSLLNFMALHGFIWRFLKFETVFLKVEMIEGSTFVDYGTSRFCIFKTVNSQIHNISVNSTSFLHLLNVRFILMLLISHCFNRTGMDFLAQFSSKIFPQLPTIGISKFDKCLF